jgi:AcrR family transcriptional regulator
MTDPDAPLVAAFWSLIERGGWRYLSAPRLAAASGVPVGELMARFRSRLDLVQAVAEANDREVEAGTVHGQGGSPRDRLFDVMMRRVDALQAHRAGAVRLLREARADPVLGLAIARGLPRSMARMLDAAGLDSTGFGGAMRGTGLTGVWLVTLRAWERDENPDLGITMAALDRALDRAEKTARSFGVTPGDLEPPLPEGTLPDATLPAPTLP